MFAEYIAIDNETRKVEVRELTETQAENLSECATVVALSFTGCKTTVWRDRVPSVKHVSRSALLELKHRAVWRDERCGMLS